MSVRTDVINLNVNVNGNAAQNQLNELRKKAADVKLELSNLKKGTQEYIDKSKELSQVNQQMVDLKKQIGLTSLTQKELNQELIRLKAMKGSVVPFTKEFYDLEKQIKATESRLYDVKNGVQGFSSFWSKINDQVKQFGILAAGYLGFQFLSQQITNIVQGAGKMSDELADVQAKTGMTNAEVEALNKSLRETDTRTSTSLLRNISAVGGQLGVAKDQIAGFTIGMDRLNVVMGDEFNGNVEDLTNSVAKVRNTFTELHSDDIQKDLLRIGNGLTVLAQNGVATAPITTDIASRIGAAGSIYGMTAKQVFGLAASYQELNISTERGSTATVKLLQKISAAPDMFYKVAQSVDPSIKSLDDFTKLVNTDITQAFLLVAKGFASSKGQATQFADQLADAEIGSAAIAEVLSKVGTNTTMVTDKIKLFGDAIQTTTAIDEQFAIKNATFGAELDKLGKEFNALVTSPAVTNFLKSAVENTIEFIKWLKDLPQWLNENRTAIIAATTVILVYNAAKLKAIAVSIASKAATIAETVADYAQIAAMYAAEAVTKAYGVAKAFLAGEITVATFAQKLWNLALKANPIGLVITLVGALATAISFLASKTKEVTAAQRVQQQITERVAESTSKEISQAQVLFQALQQKNLSRNTEIGLLQKLIAINPEFLSGLNEQNIKTAEGKSILDAYILSLQTKAEAEAKASLLADKYKERDDAYAKIRQDKRFAKYTDAQIERTASVEKSTDDNSLFAAGIKINGVKLSDLASINEEIKSLQQDVTDFTIKQVEKQVSAQKTGTAQVKTTIADLKAQLSELEKAYETMDISDTKSLKANFDKRKQLQAQIDELEGKASPSEKNQQKQYDNLKKEAAAFAKEIEKLKRDIEIDGKHKDDEELARIEKKYAELLERAKKYSFNLLIIKGLEQQELEKLFKKRFDVESTKLFEDEYGKAQDNLSDYFNQLRNTEAFQYSNDLQTKEQYSARIKQIDEDEKAAQLLTATQYSSSVKKAAQDVTNFTKQQQQLQTQNLVEETDKRIEKTNEEKLAAAKVGVLSTRPGTNANLEAQKNLLEVQFQIETAAMDKRSAMYKQKEGEKNFAIAEMEKQSKLQRIDNVLQYVDAFSNAMNSLTQIVGNREQRMLQNEKVSNDKKKNAYKQQLDNKLLNQSQYDLKIQKLDEEYDKRSRELQRKQAKRQKAISLFNTIVNTGAAIVKMLADPGGFAGVALSIAAGITGALQLGAIASEPLPELGSGRWVRTGDKHSDPSGGINAKIERDEAVMSANAMTDPNTYNISGTPSQITSKLNSMNGGAAWAAGAVIEPDWRKQKPAQINPNMVRHLASGIYNSIRDNNNGGNDMATTNNLLQTLIDKQDENTQEIRTMKKKLHAVVSIKEYRAEESKYDAAQKASSLNP